MKFVFSSYQNGEGSLALYEINKRKDHDLNVILHDKASLASPSFVISYQDLVFTYNIDYIVTIVMYKIHRNTLKLLDQIELKAKSMTHLLYSPKNHLLIGCSYQDGSYFSLEVINEHFGKILNYEVMPIIEHSVNHMINHAHCVFINKEETVVGIVNISQDAIFLYKIDHLGLTYFDNILLPSNCGPRHAKFSYDNSYIYIITEYSNEVIVIDYLTKQIIKKISTLPLSHNVSYGATICLDNSETAIYASNRGEETIIKYQIIRDHNKFDLIPCYTFSVGGEHSRHMIITSDDQYIISCNKNSNNITIIDLNNPHILKDIFFQSVSGVTEIIYK